MNHITNRFFSNFFYSHKIRLLALLGLLTGEKTDFPTVSYTSTIELVKSQLCHIPEALGTLSVGASPYLFLFYFLFLDKYFIINRAPIDTCVYNDNKDFRAIITEVYICKIYMTIKQGYI